jgi:SnoaL-like domain
MVTGSNVVSGGSAAWVGDASREVPVEDRLAIQDLLARYAHYVDNGLGEAWASTFLPEGRFEFEDKVFIGHEQLAAFAAQDIGFYPTHFVGNTLMVQVAPGVVHARSMVLVAIRSKSATPKQEHGVTIDAPTEVLGVGIYDDHIVKTEHGWKFKLRRAGSTGSAPFHSDFLPARLSC